MANTKIKIGNGTIDVITGKYERNKPDSRKRNPYQQVRPRVNVAEIRSKYRAGMVIRLISMNDRYASLNRGMIGRVTGVDDIGTIHMAWQNGSSLGLIEGVDKFEIVE